MAGGLHGEKAGWEAVYLPPNPSYPWVRRQVAVAALRARANLRINGLAWCGPGGAAAYARRHDTATGDSVARAQMEAADYATMFRKHGRDWVFHVEWGRC